MELEEIIKEKEGKKTIITMRELLEAGVHFGHQAKRWNPKMKKYIYAARNDIHVIDLHKSIPLIEAAYHLVATKVKENGTVLFVGTKKQAQEAIAEEAKRCGMFYVNEKWLGGTLTNFKTLKKNLTRIKQIEEMEAGGIFEKLTKKEVSNLKREYQKQLKALGGIREMTSLPAIMFVIDTKKEIIAVKEARRLGIAVIGVVDTNADPEDVDFPIPGNDDAIRSVKLLTSIIADAVMEGREISKPIEERLEAIAIPAELEEVAALSEEERLEEQEALRLKALKLQEEEEKERVGF
ncbi:MAG: 30S ribosomal protein S2 [Candidatus Saganbacteria bacterium]|nr:30S ribosomal protein S2 [Candidatus Saganbacteria bacterium]